MLLHLANGDEASAGDAARLPAQAPADDYRLVHGPREKHCKGPRPFYGQDD